MLGNQSSQPSDGRASSAEGGHCSVGALGKWAARQAPRAFLTEERLDATGAGLGSGPPSGRARAGRMYLYLASSCIPSAFQPAAACNQQHSKRSAVHRASLLYPQSARNLESVAHAANTLLEIDCKPARRVNNSGRRCSTPARPGTHLQRSISDTHVFLLISWIMDVDRDWTVLARLLCVHVDPCWSCAPTEARPRFEYQPTWSRWAGSHSLTLAVVGRFSR